MTLVKFITEESFSVDTLIAIRIAHLTQRVYMLRTHGGGPGMTNKAENIPMYLDRIKALLQIQKERRDNETRDPNTSSRHTDRQA